MNNDDTVNCLLQKQDIYLKSSGGKCRTKFSADDDKVDFLALYRVDEITFEDKAPRKEALENVISSMNIIGINFVYIILGDENGVNFYYGTARDFSASEKPPMEIREIGDLILKPSLQGNFRGSIIHGLNPDETKHVLHRIAGLKKARILEGVPGINKDDEGFQSVDRIINVMLGDRFALLLLANPMLPDEIIDTREKMYQLYDELSPVSKTSKQESRGTSDSKGASSTKGNSVTDGTSKSETKQDGSGTSGSKTKGKAKTVSHTTSNTTSKGQNDVCGKNIQKNNGTSNGTSDGTSDQDSDSTTTGWSQNSSTSSTNGDSHSEGKSSSDSTSCQHSTNRGTATTVDLVNKKIQEWMKYLDEVVLPRIDYGQGKGLFVSSAILFGEDKASLIKLENTIRAIYGGETGNRMPFRSFDINENESSFFRKMQIPDLYFDRAVDRTEINIRTVFSQIFPKENRNRARLGSWMSSRELSLFAGLPQKEVVGLALKEEVDFGLNKSKRESDSILLGHLVQNGIVLDGSNGYPNIEVGFEREDFDKHVFVTGVTGSGKTTTCQKLLLSSGDNFLVIEPAKTEYRVLAEKYDDLLVFTLGKENGAPFRLNPFEIFPGENITSRVDMIKASMEAAFDMEAAIPQLLEAAIYKCYEKKGWNISTNRNTVYDDPFAPGVNAFPTLGDLDQVIERVVLEQGFDERLKNDYIGSIRARLKGLLVGAKGLMLNTPRSLDFVQLMDRKVVLELENIKNGSEKSLIMGFILSTLSEAIKFKYAEKKGKIQHITLIEEAHRLLSKYMPGDSLNKKQGVEMFADMLAEVRKYGEALIIADQIPNKLTPEVLKNTNTKIVHKIFAQDDKEAIGNTMALKDEQKEYLSYLDSGKAIMMAPGFSKAMQVKILLTEDNDTERIPPDDTYLRKRIIQYYRTIYRSGILPGMEKYPVMPDEEAVELYLDYMIPGSTFMDLYKQSTCDFNITFRFVQLLSEILKKYEMRHVITNIRYVHYNENDIMQYDNFNRYLEQYLTGIYKDGQEFRFEEHPELSDCLRFDPER